MATKLVNGERVEMSAQEIADREAEEAEWNAARDAEAAILAARKTWETVADFYAEFTAAEKYAIQSSVDPAVVVARGDLAMWRASVMSDDPNRPAGTANRVTSGLDAMIAAGIIDETRKNEILT